jgi:hypothetical protein
MLKSLNGAADSKAGRQPSFLPVFGAVLQQIPPGARKNTAF